MISREPASTLGSISYAFSHEIGLNFSTPHGQKRAELRGKYFAGTTYLPNLFPAEKKDLYKVRYYSSNPNYFKVDFYDLPYTTLDKYLSNCQRVIQSGSPYFRQLHPDRITEFLAEVYTEFGITGLSMIYHHSTAFYQNLRYNSVTFYFFKKNDTWKQLMRKYAH